MPMHNDAATYQNLTPFLEQSKARVNTFLQQWFGEQNKQDSLSQAVRYAVFNGGKRIRAAMIFGIQNELALSDNVTESIAAAIECMHASSLIHDDLPALDNDALRRGKPSCHIVYGEAIAVLAGDALLNAAYDIISHTPSTEVSASAIVEMIQHLTAAVGIDGLIGGQAQELTLTAPHSNKETIHRIYHMKTGMLLGAGLQLAVIASQRQLQDINRYLQQFSYHLGVAFQIKDDLLDIESSTAELGKPQFSDQANSKSTLVSILDTQQAKQLMLTHVNSAHDCLNNTRFKCVRLHEITDFIMQRNY